MVIIVGHTHLAKNSKEWLIKSTMMETEKQPLLAKEFPKESPRGIKGLWRHDFFPCIPARYVLAIMGFLGFVNVYALRVNLSMAIVPMVNNSANASSNIVSSPNQYSVVILLYSSSHLPLLIRFDINVHSTNTLCDVYICL